MLPRWLKWALACYAGLVLTAPMAHAQTEHGKKRYIVTLELRQVHFTANPLEHLKDSANTTSFDIPVDADYFRSVHIGDTLSDKFRTGSLVTNGSYGTWSVRVKNKQEVTFSEIPR